MEIKYSNSIPDKIERIINGILLRYNVEETPMEEIEILWKNKHPQLAEEAPEESFIIAHKYKYNELKVLQGRIKYDSIVEDIIRDKYSADEMEAITNNMNAVVSEFFATLVSDGIVKATKYLVDSVNSEKMQRFKEMQEWRALAKKESKSIFESKL